MENMLTIKINKHSQAWWIAWFLAIFPLGIGFLSELLGLPYAVRYILDVVWLCSLVLMVQRRAGYFKVNIYEFWIVLFFLYTLLIKIAQGQSMLYYLWGLRNNFRFYIAFFAFCTFLTPEDIGGFIKIWDKLFWINAAACLVQFFLHDIKQDALGGIFGVIQGGNGQLNIFLVISVTKAVVSYLKKTCSVWNCILKCVTAIFLAALGEMKFFFVEVILIVLLAVLFTDFSWRKIIICGGSILLVIAGASMLSRIFPYFSGFFSVEWFWNTATSGEGYTGSGDLNRLNAISKINDLWLQNGWQQLFGLGLGNCDTSAFALLNTPFFEKYGDMHYTWLSYAMIYLETGWIGLIFYFGFFLLVYRGICRIQKRVQGEAVCYCLIGRIMAILCMVISIYNSSLRTEAGYMAYFVLAIPFIYGKCGKWEITCEL